MRFIVLPMLMLALTGSAVAADRPNILWLSAEDISCHLGCYGDAVAKTPTLDALAAAGVRYDNAFTHAPVCAVVRSGVITGVYPVSLGTHQMRCRVAPPAHVRCFTEYLRDAGYYCTNNSKEDYNFRPPQTAWDESSRTAHWRNRGAQDQPFFAVFNFTGTHESAVRGDEPAYSRTIARLRKEELTDPEEVSIAPYHPDTPQVREVYARSYNTIAALDHWVAGKLEELDDAGVADETIVVFWSDHGTSLPRGKRWLYDSGVRIPLIIRVPDKWRRLANGPAPGSVADDLVSSIDFAPTTLNLAGVPVPGHMNGRAALGPDRSPEREQVFLHRDRMDERYDMSRGLRTKRYKYLRNFIHWRPYLQRLEYAERSPVLKEMRRLKAEGKLSPVQLAFMADTKPVEELYDIQADPHEINNLASDPQHADRLAVFRAEVERRMHELGDLGVVPESRIYRWAGDAGAAAEIGKLMREASGSEGIEHSLLIRTACFVASPPPPPGDPVINVTLALGFKNPNRPGGASYAVWGTRVARLSLGSLVDGISSEQALKLVNAGPGNFGDQPADVRVEWGELLNRTDEGVQILVDVLTDESAGFARLQAGNALDLIPDFDRHADRLRPAVERVRAAMKPPSSGHSLENYLKDCIDRLADRLEM